MSYSEYNNFLCIENIDKGLLDLDKTLDCGQCFRWRKLQDGTWIGVVNNQIFMVKNKEINGKHCIITTASKEEWENILYKYFDLDTDYEAKLSIPSSDTFALKAREYGKGIRILKQDKWEALVSFIISQRNNIPKIMSTIDKLCKAFGNKIEIEVLGRKYENYTFPNVDTLANLDISDLDGIGLGYRDEYILLAAKYVKNNWIDLEKLSDKNISGSIAVDNLLELRGVGPKVANCVALFGLHKLDMFPIDVWIQRIIDDYYDGILDHTVYGELAGLVQQYMFFYIKYNKL